MAQNTTTWKSPAARYQDYVQAYADRVIKFLEEGTAPWVKPWRAGFLQPGAGMPYNAITGKGYSGSNVLLLRMIQQAAGFEDERWLTFNQGMSLGCHLKKGSKGVQCVKWIEPKENDPKPDEEAKAQKRRVPVLFTVFNASQFEGLPAAPVREPPKEPERHAQCEALIAATGALIAHDGGNRAFYRPMTDDIHLPMREAFKTADSYYATVLHELGHWSGHPTRLARDLTGRFGSEQYAKEELRAELASMMVGERLGIGHDPGQHVAYIGHWIKLLKEHPKEILVAAKDADAICTYLGVHKFEHEPMKVPEKTKEREEGKPQARPLPRRTREKQRERAQEMVR